MTYDEYYMPGGPYEQAYLTSLNRVRPPKDYILPNNQSYSQVRAARNKAAYDRYQAAYVAGATPEQQTVSPNAGALVPDGFFNTQSGSKRTAGSKAAKNGKLGGFFDELRSGVTNAVNSAIDAGKQGWANIKAGKGVMPKYAGLAKGAMGVMTGLKAAQEISDYQNAQGDTEDLVNNILASAAGNDNYRYDLSADQLKTLRQLQNGTFDISGDFDMGSVLDNLGNIATGAGLGFVTGGGIPGALLGAAGGVVDGVSSGMVNSQNQITADLEGLYQALYESEMRNKAMKRDAAMQRYANSLYL